jgi:hypothetical protein
MKNKTAQMPGMEEMDDAIVRVPGRAAELVRLAMMHDPVARGMSMKSMLGSLCIQYAEGVIAERGVSVPEHLALRSNGGAR